MKQIDVFNPSGELVSIPEAQLNDALKQEYRLAAPSEVAAFEEKKKFTSGAQPALAGLAGAARALTFGGSDVALTKTGIVEPKTLENLEKYNPVESLGGEAAAIAGSMLIPVYGEATAARGLAARAARAVTAPVRGATAASEAIIKGTAGMLPATTGAQRIGQAALSTAVGAGAEAGLYGMGKAVSEYAMGKYEDMDPQSIGESVLSHVGVSALLGAGVGGVLGASFGLSREAYSELKRIFPDVASPTETLKNLGIDVAPGIPKTQLGDALGIEGKSAAEQRQFAKGLSRRSEIADDVEAIARKHNLPVYEEQLSRDIDVLKKAEALRNSGSPIGIERKRGQQQAWDYWRNQIDNTLAPADEIAGMSQKEVGDLVVNKLADKLTETQTAHSSRFKLIHEVQQTVDLPDATRLKFYQKAEDMAAKFGTYGDEPFDEAIKAANSVLSRNNGSELLVALSNLKETSRNMFMTGRLRAGTAVSDIVDAAEDMLFKEVLRKGRALEKEGAEFGGVIAKDIVKEIKTAMRDYASFAKERKKVAEALGIGGNKNTSQIRQILLEKKNPQEIVNRLFSNRNVKTAEFFEKYAPDIMKDIKAFQREELRTSAIAGEGMPLNPKTVFKKVGAMEKELKNMLFSSDEQMLMREGELFLRSIPDDFNKSGTASALAYMDQNNLLNIFQPGKMRDAWTSLGKDAQSASQLRQMGITSDDLAKAHWITEKTLSTKRAISKGAKAIFEVGETIGQANSRGAAFASAQIAEAIVSHEEPKKVIRNIRDIANNPEMMIERIGKGTEAISDIMPNAAQMMQASAVKAVQYLAALAPDTESAFPLGEDPEPSSRELNIFSERMNLIKKPVKVLDELRLGTLVPEHIELVSTIYPKLYQDMQKSVMEQLFEAKAKKKPISHYKKNMLSLFLNQDLDYMVTPQAILENQAAIAKSHMNQQAQQNQAAGNVKSTQTGLGKLDASTQNLTQMQKSARRIDG